MAKVTIEGKLDSVMNVLGKTPMGPKSLRRAEREARLKTLLEKRRLVRSAFEMVRYTKDDRRTTLLHGLTAVNGISDAVMEIARQVLADHQ